MKALITGDIHFHKYKMFNQNNRRLDNIGKYINYIFSYVKERDIDYIIITGDLYNNMEVVSTEVENKIISVFTEGFKKKVGEKPPFVIAISGNHDYATKNLIDSPAVSALDRLDEIFDNFKLIKGKDPIALHAPDNSKVHIYGVPYYEYPEHFRQALSDIKVDPAASLSYLLMHQTVGMENEMIQEDISPKDPLLKKFTLVFNGHVHKCGKHSNNFINIGSPMHRDAGDIGVSKGFWTVDLMDPGSLTFIDITKMFPQYIYKNEGEELTEWEKEQYVIFNPVVIKSANTDVEKNFTTNVPVSNILENYCKEVGATKDQQVYGLNLLKNASSAESKVGARGLAVQRDLNFNTLEVEGFRSLVKPTTFNLHRPGLNFLKGASGVGKTSIFEAIVWVLFGVNLKDTLAEKVVSWPEARGAAFRGTRAAVTFKTSTPCAEYRIIRHIGFKGETEGLKGNDKLMIFKDGHLIGDELNKAGMQDYINSILGVNASVFVNSIVFGQNMVKLIDSDNKNKRQLFEEMFDVEWVDGLREIASADKDNLSHEIQNLETTVYKTNHLKETLEEKLEADLAILSDFDQQKYNEIQSLNEDGAGYNEEIYYYNESLKELVEPVFIEGELEKVEKQEQNLKDQCVQMTAQLSGLKDKLVDTALRNDKMTEKETILIGECEKLRKEKDVRESRMTTELNDINKQLKELTEIECPEGDVESLKFKFNELLIHTSQLKSELSLHNHTLTQLQKSDKELRDKLPAIEEQLGTTPEQCDKCLQHIKGESYNNFMASVLKNKKQIESELKSNGERQITLRGDIDKIHDWLGQGESEIAHLELHIKDHETYIEAQQRIDQLKTEESYIIQRADSIIRELSKCDKDLVEVEEAIKDLQEGYDKFKSQYQELKVKFIAVEAELLEKTYVLEGKRNIQRAWMEYSKQTVALESNIKESNIKLEGIVKQIEAVQERKPPKVDTEAVAAKVKEAESALIKLEVEKDNKNNQLELAIWWIKQFGAGGIKNYVFSAMLQKLNGYIAKYGSRLGISINFNIDLSKASKPFTAICSLGEVKDKDYDEFSGGQRQRLDIVLMMAMHDLISQVVDINILLLDEIFTGLDEAGEAVVFDLIRIKAENKSVYVISHSAVLDSLYSRTILFSLDNFQTRITSN